MAATLTFVKLVILMGLSANFVCSALEWPKECANKYYCHIKPNHTYPDEAFIDSLFQEEIETVSGVSNRAGELEEADIALCERRKASFLPIYAIKDENNVVWYVPQSNKFNIIVQVAGCKNTGRILGEKGLNSKNLNETEVHCFEQRMSFEFLVLSQDLTKLEEKSISPHHGLPISCSAKVFKK